MPKSVSILQVGRTVSLALLLAAPAAAQTPPPQPPERPPAGQVEPAPGNSSLKRLSIEELARISVQSVSRRSENVTEAPAAVTVITGDALRRSGVTTLNDALRLAVGVAVARDGHTWSISARGFNAPTANKMVVMLDGRSLYTPLFSGVFWDVQDMLIADVDRIEIIRGGGGTLWGANAVNGVINIITKLAADTQGGLAQIGGGSSLSVLGLRYGGRAGTTGSYRVYAKFRRDEGQPFTTGVDSDETLKSGQAGVRFDFGPSSPTSITLQGDMYTGNTDLSPTAPTSGEIDFGGGNVLARIRHTYRSGAQVEFQGYYDGTSRKVPGQYAERRNTAELELQYHWSGGRRHDLTAGLGTLLTHDRVTPGGSLFFDPASRTITRVNVFVQDEISLPGRLTAILGTKLERNTYTGFEYQPNARLKWNVGPGQVLWGGISRGIRVPSRFDTDLRFTAATPIVVLTGSPDFLSETVISREAGYRTYLIPKLALGINGFVNSYDALRTQEPTPPVGIPIVLANKQAGRVSGIEIGAHYEPWAAWQVWGGYAYLHERFEFDADSRDRTGGSLEHNDPSHSVWLRSFSDLPKKFMFDATFRGVGALPRPAVPSYGELTLRVARPITRSVEVEVIGDNLLHDRHLEFVNLGPAHAVPRSIFARLTWRSR